MTTIWNFKYLFWVWNSSCKSVWWFIGVLKHLFLPSLKVQECYELSAEYENKRDPKKLEELGNVLTSLDPGDSIVLAKAFSHMLSLANLAEEVQIAYRRRNKKKGDYTDENSATTESDIEETLKRLVVDLKKSPQEVFDALKNQTVDLVFTAHPTQSVRRSLLQKHGRLDPLIVMRFGLTIRSFSLTLSDLTCRFSGSGIA